MALKDVYKEVFSLIEDTDVALTKKTTGKEIRDAISVSLVSIAKQHYRTIVTSSEVNTQVNSAFALLRPLVDATYRIIWVMFASTENQVIRIGDGSRQFLSTYELSDKIDRKLGGTAFNSRYKYNSPILHGMTHGGLELIGRQTNGKYIEPNFEEIEIVGLLHEATMNYGMLLFNYGRYIEDEELILIGGHMVKDIDLIKIHST